MAIIGTNDTATVRVASLPSGAAFDNAANVTFSPTSGISATNVQGAIAELEGDALLKTGNLLGLDNVEEARENLGLKDVDFLTSVLQADDLDRTVSITATVGTSSPSYIVDAADFGGVTHYITFAGAGIIDVSNLKLNKDYHFCVRGGRTTRVTLDAGPLVTIVGSQERYDVADLNAITLTLGQSVTLRRVTNSQIFAVAFNDNPNIVRSSPTGNTRWLQQPNGRYTIYHRQTMTASALTTISVALSGLSIDFTNAFVAGLIIYEGNTTSRDPLKVGTLSTSGGAGTAQIYNPNAAGLSVGVTLHDVEVTGV